MITMKGQKKKWEFNSLMGVKKRQKEDKQQKKCPRK